MSKTPVLPRDTVLHVRDHCLCLHARRAARALARHFDHAFLPLEITNGQFSLMMALNQPEPPRIGRLAEFLAMDRTSLTAALKPLERRGLIEVIPDPGDRRGRVIRLTRAGRGLLARAVPVWKRAHAEVDAHLVVGGPTTLRDHLNVLARLPMEPDPAPARPPARSRTVRRTR